MAENSFDGERLNRYFKGYSSDKDASYVNEVFCDKKTEKELESHLRRQWHELFQEEMSEDKSLDHILHRIHYEINTNSAKTKERKAMSILVKWFSRIAAILIIPLAIYSAVNLFDTVKKDNLAWVEIKAPAWTRAQFSLPDGTTGWLNSNSSIKYNVDFKSNRNVKLDGEANFVVVRDLRKPFKVEADEISVTVLGTRFNIASYEDEDQIEVVLEEGEIMFEEKKSNISYTLQPKDFLAFNKTTNEFRVDVVQPEKYSSWKEGKLVFRNDPIEVIARRLARWYNIEVEVRGEINNQNGLWATFIDENLEEVLKLLKRSLPIKYEIIRPQVHVDGIYDKTKVIITII